MSILTDLSFLLFLIVLNGLFAMSEIAIVSSRRARLLQMAEDDNRARDMRRRLRLNPRASSRACRWALRASAF